MSTYQHDSANLRMYRIFCLQNWRYVENEKEALRH